MSDAGLSRLRVECYAGYRADEEPQRFFIGEREVSVVTIIDRWLDPERRYFKVLGSDGGTYILCHVVRNGLWELTLYDSGQHDTTRLSST